MSIQLYGGGGAPRRVLLSCDVAGCPVQLEPPAAERWRSDADALKLARAQAHGWRHDASGDADYCPEHAESSAAESGGKAPRPTAAARDREGNPLDRDGYAARLREQLAGDGRPSGKAPGPTAAQSEVVARLLDELAGVYDGESLGALAGEQAALLRRQFGEQS